MFFFHVNPWNFSSLLYLFSNYSYPFKVLLTGLSQSHHNFLYYLQAYESFLQMQDMGS